VKPWQGPLPKSRVSPPKTLGDAVIKNARIRVRGAQTVPVSFKMVLPSTMNETSSSPKLAQPSRRNTSPEPWSSLSEIRSPRITQERTARSSPDSAMFESSTTGHRFRDLNFTKDGIQNLKPIQIQTGSAQAWFYPSKGLSELFSRAGKPRSPGGKTHTTLV
jgi:hypothetical protein